MDTAAILKRFFLLSILIGTALAPTPHAGTLSVNVVAMFPKSTAEFAYADLKEVRKFPWYAQFKSQVLPSRFSDLENLLASAGVNPNLQIDELAWALSSGETDANGIDQTIPNANTILGIVIGDFDAESAEGYMRAHKLPAVEYRSYRIYSCFSCDDTSIIFIDSSTIAFGKQRLLERLIDVRAGTDDSLIQNEKLFALITQINGGGVFWGALNSAGTGQAVRQMVPEATKFPQASKLLNRLKGLAISIQGSSDLEAHFQLVSSSPEDAGLISQLLQAGVLLRQSTAKNSDPDLAALLSSVRIVPNGDGLEASFAVTNDQVINLINRNTFSASK